MIDKAEEMDAANPLAGGDGGGEHRGVRAVRRGKNRDRRRDPSSRGREAARDADPPLLIDRPAIINRLLGRPYRADGYGPAAFGCYGLTRHLQRVLYGRELPLIEIPPDLERTGMAGLIETSPERARWRAIDAPEDGAVVQMFRNNLGYHIGTYIDLDGGLVVHAIEPSVQADSLMQLAAADWRRFRYFTRA